MKKDLKEKSSIKLNESNNIRWLLIFLALVFLSIFLFIPLIAVFSNALKEGFQVFQKAISEPDTRAAIRLTMLVVSIAIPLNIIFGISAAWAVTKFKFKGQNESQKNIIRSKNEEGC